MFLKVKQSSYIIWIFERPMTYLIISVRSIPRTWITFNFNHVQFSFNSSIRTFLFSNAQYEHRQKVNYFTCLLGCSIWQNGQMNGLLYINITFRNWKYPNPIRKSHLFDNPFFEHHRHNRVPQHKSCVGLSNNNLHSSQNKLRLISFWLRTFIPSNNLFVSFDIAMKDIIVK
jgi:hypothetical protein